MAFELVFIEPAKKILAQVGDILSGIVLVILTLLVGWLIAKLIEFVVVRILDMLKVDEFLNHAKVNDFLVKGGIKLSFSEIIGRGCYWIVLLIATIIAINNVGLTAGQDLLNRVILYIPNVFVAVFIVILSMFAANFLSSVVQAFASNAGVAHARGLGRLAAVVVVIFAALIALEQLSIKTEILQHVVIAVIASLGLGLALAFGLGCRDMAEKFMQEFIEKFKVKK